MKKIIWNLQYLTVPPILRYCKKCGKKTEFICSDQFRVNANRRQLDIWLIYRCSICDTTWNAAVHSRISLQTLTSEQLERFHNNDKTLAEQYAMDMHFLHRNGAEIALPEYSVIGEDFDIGEQVELTIISEYSLPVKVSVLIKNKLKISHKVYSELIEKKKIVSSNNQNLQKCKLKNGIVLLFQSANNEADEYSDLPREVHGLLTTAE